MGKVAVHTSFGGVRRKEDCTTWAPSLYKSFFHVPYYETKTCVTFIT